MTGAFTHASGVKSPRRPGRPAFAWSLISAAIGLVRKAGATVALLVKRYLQAHAEAHQHTLRIEEELYRGRYRHTSKNDDDLPVVRFPSIL